MNKHILQSLILISILFLISACDCPPPENDYTWADVPVPEKDAEESYKTLLEIADINFDRSLTNFSSKNIYANPEKYEKEIETAWENSTELHNLFDKLDSYKEIADLNVSITDNLDICSPLKNATILYATYSRLKIAQGQYDEAIIPLLKINSITRKVLPYTRGLITKLISINIEGIYAKAAYIIATNNYCSVEIIRKLKTPFLPLTDKELSLEYLAISEYLITKNILFDGTNAAFKPDKLKPLFFLIKKNKTLQSVKKHTDLFLSCLSNSPPDFSKYTAFVDNYIDSPDYLNYMGWIVSKINIGHFDKIAISFFKTKVKSDLLAIKIHEKCGETLELNDPFTGKKYLRNSDTGNYSSAGPDGIYKTKDDIFL